MGIKLLNPKKMKRKRQIVKKKLIKNQKLKLI